MTHLIALTLVAALASLGVPALSDSAQDAQAPGHIAGVARDARQQPLAFHTIQLVNLDTGLVVASLRTDAAGRFDFSGLGPGRYMARLLDANSKVICTSAALSLTTAITEIRGVAFCGQTALLGAVPPAVGIGAFFASTAGIVILAAAGAGATIGIVYATRPASPSK